MAKRCVLVMVMVALLGGSSAVAVSAWSHIYSDSDYLTGTGDCWYYSMKLVAGTGYRFVLTNIPWSADFDMRIWRDYDNDRRLEEGEKQATFNDGGNGQDEDGTWFAPQSATYILEVYSYHGSGYYSLSVYKWI